MDLHAGMSVVGQATSEDVDTAGFTLAPGRGPLPSVLPSVVAPPSTGGDGVLGGDLLQTKIINKISFQCFFCVN